MNQVIVVGGANLDIVAHSISVISTGDSNSGRVSTGFGGVARNVAENLARLLINCRFISAVGDDANGEALLRHTAQAGVNINAVLRVVGARTAMYVSVHDKAGELIIAVNDMTVLNELTASHLINELELSAPPHLIVADANLSSECLEDLFLSQSVAKIPIFMDAVSTYKARRIKAWLPYIHTLKPNLLEAEELSGLSLDKDAAIPVAAQWFLKQGIKNIVISLGKRGLYYANASEQGWVEPLTVTIENTSGAGDALMAGLVYGYLNEFSLLQSARFAQACSALTLKVEQTNNSQLSIAAIENILAKQN